MQMHVELLSQMTGVFIASNVNAEVLFACAGTSGEHRALQAS